ncbi:hypothetical protein QYF61_010379 [Mycteria americana]|uniref:LRRNT domain-containing protein n=1 Tax=Mycteria americana TaxID=33587 RepID=A0AAN7N9X2_MYCAM|nr:hypothetical protein QYF61_010379 [Mycteria americana]
MGCWMGPSTVLACLLLLRPLPSPACPAVCRCSLGEVDCSERALRDVPQSLSANTSTLWLGYNFITVLGPHSFPPLPGLLLLSLPHNRLALIHSQALVGLGALQELDLSNNYLTVLTPETFLPLTSLATLNLGSNMLGELEPGVLHTLPQLRTLLLQDNPWVCSCGILPLWRWLSHNREKVRGECPEDRVPKPPTRSTLAGHPIGAEAGPSTLAASWPWAHVVSARGGTARFPRTRPQAMAAPVFAWVDASLGLVPGAHPRPPAGTAWRGGLGNGPATGTQHRPQWHQSCHEKNLLLCRAPKQLNKYPIMAFGNESFRQCQETPLSAQHYITFLIIGPFSFMASIFFCTFMGSIIVIYHNLRRESHFWRRPRICRGC